MLEGLAAAVLASAPLRIGEIEYNDPVLILAGDDWSLALECPWHIEDGLGAVVVRWDDESVEDRAWDLIGASVRAAEDAGGGDRPATALRLSDGLRLVITPDTDLDPWVLQLPPTTTIPSHVFVGP